MSRFRVTGLNLNVSKKLASGRVVYKHYAWRGRGAPCVGETDAPIRGALSADMVARIIKAQRQRDIRKPPASDNLKLADLFGEWQCSAEWRILKPGTRANYRLGLKKWDRARDPATGKVYCDMPIAAIVDDRACAAFLRFRDANTRKWMALRLEKARAVRIAQRSTTAPPMPALGAIWIDTSGIKERAYEYRETLKAADDLITTLSACLGWAAGRKLIKVNQVAGVGKLYKSNRAALIFSADDLAKVQAGEADPNKPRPCPPQVWNMVCGAVLTGLAQADLIRLSWPMVCEDVIDLAGGRTKTGQEAMPPVLEEARALFDRIEAEQRATATFKPDGLVFLNSRGQRWTKDGFKSSWAYAKTASSIADELHFHDLRGTAATQFMVQGFTSDQVDLFMGWKSGESARIRRKYIAARNVAKGVQTFLKGATRARLAAAN